MDAEGDFPPLSRRGVWETSFYALVGTRDQPACGLDPRRRIWTCRRHRVYSPDQAVLRGVFDHDPPASSADVPCGEWAVSLAAIGGPGALVCATHRAWLEEHQLIDHTLSDSALELVDGVWRTTLGWEPSRPALILPFDQL